MSAPRRFSRSRSRSPRYTRRFSRSRSPEGANRRSRSPMSNRRRHDGNRENPTDSNCLGVFGLSLYTTERELEKEFSRFGPLEKVQVVLDGKTGRSRGFGFVYFEALEDAKAAKEAMADQEIDGRRIRVDFSITKRAHTPTPGVYMGRPTYREERGRGGYRGGYRGRGGGGHHHHHYGGGGHHAPYHHHHHHAPPPHHAHHPPPYDPYGGHHGGYAHQGYSGHSSHYSRRSPSPHYRGSRYRSRSRSYSPRQLTYPHTYGRDNYY